MFRISFSSRHCLMLAGRALHCGTWGRRDNTNDNNNKMSRGVTWCEEVKCLINIYADDISQMLDAAHKKRWSEWMNEKKKGLCELCQAAQTQTVRGHIVHTDKWSSRRLFVPVRGSVVSSLQTNRSGGLNGIKLRPTVWGYLGSIVFVLHPSATVVFVRVRTSRVKGGNTHLFWKRCLEWIQGHFRIIQVDFFVRA